MGEWFIFIGINIPIKTSTRSQFFMKKLSLQGFLRRSPGLTVLIGLLPFTWALLWGPLIHDKNFRGRRVFSCFFGVYFGTTILFFLKLYVCGFSI